jgi:hypothetical protein
MIGAMNDTFLLHRMGFTVYRFMDVLPAIPDVSNFDLSAQRFQMFDQLRCCRDRFNLAVSAVRGRPQFTPDKASHYDRAVALLHMLIGASVTSPTDP